MEPCTPRDTTPTEDLPRTAAAPGEAAEISRAGDNTKVRVDDTAIPTEKKKTKKRKSAAKKRGTGFEEYYCDPPMTPAEYNEERQVLYPPHRPFVDRIEECIQRFRARRRLDSHRNDLFSKYLMLGGIDATTRQFQSADNITDDVLEDAEKSAIREMTAEDVIQRGVGSNSNPRFFNPNDAEHWSVDFTGVAAGFLSEHIPSLMGRNEADIRKAAEVVANFLRYVDIHDVCPEYADDIKRAQKICDLAVEETPILNTLSRLLPGHFNTSLRMLFVKDDAADDALCVQESPVRDVQEAKASHAATVCIMTPEQVQNTTASAIISTSTVTSTEDQAYEVHAITLPTETQRAMYQAINHHLSIKGSAPGIQPCGTATMRPVIIRDGWDNSATATVPPEEDIDTQFILEEDILKLLRIGMKLRLRVCTLSTGLKFIKHVRQVLPTFYVFLPQELMLDFKAPVENDRPAKSIHDVGSDGCEEPDDE
ncbi:hypothetical protein VTJ83DRAFT_4443 [Remersonia thermophila]|uniref:Argonaute complex, subunit Arb1 n=1 Tax=Remersonia thermophila TaxID=72144 RepID=A0ABR4D9Z7_9PEZI